MEAIVPKKRKQSPHTKGPGSAALVNSLSVSTAQMLYDLEVKQWSAMDKGCRVSTRKLAAGQYPRPQIQKYLGEQFKDLPPSQCRVFVSHLCLRAQGLVLPAWEANEDVMHSCHRGKAKFDGDRSCITFEHLSIGDHGINMGQQNCLPIRQCPNCHLLMRCNHDPFCIGSPEAEAMLQQQKKAVKICIEYEDGSSEIVLL